MQLKGTVTIKAPRARVWEFLTDPHQVSQCAPGVESVEVTEVNIVVHDVHVPSDDDQDDQADSRVE